MKKTLLQWTVLPMIAFVGFVSLSSFTGESESGGKWEQNNYVCESYRNGSYVDNGYVCTRCDSGTQTSCLPKDCNVGTCTQWRA